MVGIIIVFFIIVIIIVVSIAIMIVVVSIVMIIVIIRLSLLSPGEQRGRGEGGAVQGEDVAGNQHPMIVSAIVLQLLMTFAAFDDFFSFLMTFAAF